MTISTRSIQRLRGMARGAREVADELNGTLERCDCCDRQKARNENEWRAMHRALKLATKAVHLADFMEKALKEKSEGGCDTT